MWEREKKWRLGTGKKEPGRDSSDHRPLFPGTNP